MHCIHSHGARDMVREVYKLQQIDGSAQDFGNSIAANNWSYLNFVLATEIIQKKFLYQKKTLNQNRLAGTPLQGPTCIIHTVKYLI